MPQEIKKIDLASAALMVVDRVNAMLAYWDKDLICRFANAAYLDWFGRTREEMVDKMHISELLGPLYQLNLPYINGVLDGEPQLFERQIPVTAIDVRYVLANYIPHKIDGKIVGFFAHVADITPK
jgi:PAS domain S-box-containing protein